MPGCPLRVTCQVGIGLIEGAPIRVSFAKRALVSSDLIRSDGEIIGLRPDQDRGCDRAALAKLRAMRQPMVKSA